MLVHHHQLGPASSASHSSSVWLRAPSPPEVVTVLQRWWWFGGGEPRFQNNEIRSPRKGCLSSFPCGQYHPGTVLPSGYADCTPGRPSPQTCSPLTHLTGQKPGGGLAPGWSRQVCGSWGALLVPKTTSRSWPSPSITNLKEDALHRARLWSPAFLPDPATTTFFPNRLVSK